MRLILRFQIEEVPKIRGNFSMFMNSSIHIQGMSSNLAFSQENVLSKSETLLCWSLRMRIFTKHRSDASRWTIIGFDSLLTWRSALKIDSNVMWNAVKNTGWDLLQHAMRNKCLEEVTVSKVAAQQSIKINFQYPAVWFTHGSVIEYDQSTVFALYQNQFFRMAIVLQNVLLLTKSIVFM